MNTFVFFYTDLVCYNQNQCIIMAENLDSAWCKFHNEHNGLWTQINLVLNETKHRVVFMSKAAMCKGGIK